MHRRCQRIVASKSRGRSSAAQRLTDLEHERKSYAIQQVEEFWVSDKSGDCCQIPQESRSTVSCSRSLMVTETGGERDYVSLDSRWRCGSGMTLPHSTQCTLPALCSSSETQSEITRLCRQIAGGVIGRVCGAGPDFSRFTVHLRDASRYR